MANTANEQYNNFIAAYRSAYPLVKTGEAIRQANVEWKLVKPGKGKNASDAAYKAKLQELFLLAHRTDSDNHSEFTQLFGITSTTSSGHDGTLIRPLESSSVERDVSTSEEPETSIDDSRNEQLDSTSSNKKQRKRSANAQEKTAEELELIDAQIAATEGNHSLGIPSVLTRQEVHELRAKRIEKERHLLLLRANCARQQKYRDHRRRTLLQAVSDNPELEAKLRRITRPSPGQPPLAANPPVPVNELYRTIVEIANALNAIEGKKTNLKLSKSCNSINDLVLELAKTGLFLMRSTAYIRIIPHWKYSKEDKNRVQSVPVRPIRPGNAIRKDHVDHLFASSTINQLEDICGLFGAGNVFFLNQISTAKVLLGTTAKNEQAPILVLYEPDCTTNSPNSDETESRKPSLIPCIYAGCTIKDHSVSHVGATYIAIRSGKHDKITPQTFCSDILHIIRQAGFADAALNSFGHVKPIMAIMVDGEDGGSLQSEKTIAASVHLFRKCDLDVLFIASHAPGHSACRTAHRRMAPLAKQISGLIFPRAQFGTHLNVNGETIDPRLEIENVNNLNSCIARVWSESIVDGYPVIARTIPAAQPASILTDYCDQVDRIFRVRHIRTSQYFTQIVKCSDTNCCKPLRTNYAQVFPDRFIPGPVRYTYGLRGPMAADPDSVDSSAAFRPFFVRLALKNLDPPGKYGPLPYDCYCSSVRWEIDQRTCQKCGLYEADPSAFRAHYCVSSTATDSQNYTFSSSSNNRNYSQSASSSSLDLGSGPEQVLSEFLSPVLPFCTENPDDSVGSTTLGRWTNQSTTTVPLIESIAKWIEPCFQEEIQERESPGEDDEVEDE